MELYQKLNVPELPGIQQEILEYIDLYPEILKVKDVNEVYFSDILFKEFPILNSFLVPRLKTPIYQTSITFAPPFCAPLIHIDGLRADKSWHNVLYNNTTLPLVKQHTDFFPEGTDFSKMLPSAQYTMVIPIKDFEKSITQWYETDVTDDNEIIVNLIKSSYPYNFHLLFLKKEASIPIGHTCIDHITFIRSNLYHAIVNQQSKTRIAVVVRCIEYHAYDSVDQLFDVSGLV